MAPHFLKIFSLMTLIGVLLGASRVEAVVPSCELTISDERFYKQLADFTEKIKDNPIQISEPQKSPLGGLLYTLTRTGSTWNSSYSDFHNAPQGDPRAIFSQLGRGAAEYLGFKLIDSRTMIVPDADHLNAALDRVNSVLPEATHFRARFFNTDPFEPIVNSTDFLRAYSDHNMYPIATRGSTLMHDISYHVSAIIYPRRALEQSRRNTQFFFKFWEFAEPQLKKQFGKRGVNGLHVVAKHIADNVDAYMGNFGALLPREVNEKTVFSIYSEVLGLVGRGQSSIGRVRFYMDNSFGYLPIRHSNFIDEMLGSKREQIRARIESLYTEFVSQPQVASSEYAKPFSIEPKEIMESVNYERDLLSQATSQLNSTTAK